MADHVHPGAEEVAIGQRYVSERLEQHQEYRRQHGDQGDAEAWQFGGVRLAGQLVHQLLVRMAGDVLGNERTKDRPGNDGRRQRYDQAIENGLADVGAKHADRQQRPRVRRHQAVDGGKTGQQRDTDLDDRHAGATCDDEHQRDQQHEADFEEQRDAHQERGEHHGPLHLVLAEGADQGLGDLIGPARLGHHFAEHRAQRQDDADKAQHTTEAVLERLDDGAGRHARRQAEERGGDGQCNERVEFELGDEDDESDHRDHCIKQQERLVGHAEHGRCLLICCCY